MLGWIATSINILTLPILEEGTFGGHFWSAIMSTMALLFKIETMQQKKGFLVNLQLEHVVRYFALRCYQSNKNAYHGSTFQDRDLQEKPNTTNHQLEDVFGHLGWEPFPKIATMAVQLVICNKPNTILKFGWIFNLNMLSTILDISHYQKSGKISCHGPNFKDRDLQQKLHTTKFGWIFNLNIFSAISHGSHCQKSKQYLPWLFC